MKKYTSLLLLTLILPCYAVENEISDFPIGFYNNISYNESEPSLQKNGFTDAQIEDLIKAGAMDLIPPAELIAWMSKYSSKEFNQSSVQPVSVTPNQAEVPRTTPVQPVSVTPNQAEVPRTTPVQPVSVTPNQAEVPRTTPVQQKIHQKLENNDESKDD